MQCQCYSEESAEAPGTLDGCEPHVGCWEANPSPQEEYPVFVTTEPSLRPPLLQLLSGQFSCGEKESLLGRGRWVSSSGRKAPELPFLALFTLYPLY